MTTTKKKKIVQGRRRVEKNEALHLIVVASKPKVPSPYPAEAKKRTRRAGELDNVSTTLHVTQHKIETDA